MRVAVDQDACVGCGFCVRACSQLFRMDFEAAKSRVKFEFKIPSELEDCAREAEEGCPVSAITLEKDEASDKSDKV